MKKYIISLFLISTVLQAAEEQRLALLLKPMFEGKESWNIKSILTAISEKNVGSSALTLKHLGINGNYSMYVFVPYYGHVNDTRLDFTGDLAGTSSCAHPNNDKVKKLSKAISGVIDTKSGHILYHYGVESVRNKRINLFPFLANINTNEQPPRLIIAHVDHDNKEIADTFHGQCTETRDEKTYSFIIDGNTYVYTVNSNPLPEPSEGREANTPLFTKRKSTFKKVALGAAGITGLGLAGLGIWNFLNHKLNFNLYGLPSLSFSSKLLNISTVKTLFSTLQMPTGFKMPNVGAYFTGFKFPSVSCFKK